MKTPLPSLACLALFAMNLPACAAFRRDATAVDRTLRTQIGAIECPVAFQITPTLFGITITPRIVYRNPATPSQK